MMVSDIVTIIVVEYFNANPGIAIEILEVAI